jgi:hypothetical protein
MSKGVLKDYLRVEPSNFKFENVNPMSDRFSAFVELSKRSAALEARESKPDSAILNSASASGCVEGFWVDGSKSSSHAPPRWGAACAGDYAACPSSGSLRESFLIASIR